MNTNVLQPELDFESPPRASASVVDAAVEWLRNEISRMSARQRAGSAADGSGLGILCSPVVPLEEVSFGAVAPICPPEEQSLRRGRRKAIEDVMLRQPRQGPPDLNAAVLTFPARLLKYVNERWGGDAPRVYKRAHIARGVYSRIVSNNLAKVSKETAMKFAIGLQLDRDEADLLLQSAGYSFSDSIPWDMVFSYCIEHRIWNFVDLNNILTRSGCAPVKLD